MSQGRRWEQTPHLIPELGPVSSALGHGELPGPAGSALGHGELLVPHLVSELGPTGGTPGSSDNLATHSALPIAPLDLETSWHPFLTWELAPLIAPLVMEITYLYLSIYNFL